MGDGKNFSHFSLVVPFCYECNFYGRQSAGKKGRGNTMGIFDSAVGYFVRGGLCMWPLLFCSLAVIFLAVERYVYYRQAISDTKFVMMFCKEMTRGKVSEAAGLAEKESAALQNWQRIFCLKRTALVNHLNLLPMKRRIVT